MLRRLAPYLAYFYLTLVKITTRLKIIGQEKRDALRAKNIRCVYAFWHNQQVFFTCSHRKDNLSVLVSLSRDGEIVAEIMRLSKIRASRGSSSRGASGALKEMLALVGEGLDLGITPDGPKGPTETVKPGALFLAQKLGIPILPISNALSRKIVIKKSWDQYQVPLPFGKAAIVYDDPIFVGPDDDLRLKAEEVTVALKSATLVAEKSVSSSGSFSIFFVLTLENLLFPFIAFFFLLKFLFSNRRRVLLGLNDEFKERFGFLGAKNKISLLNKKTIWIHAASAGEVASVVPFLRLLKNDYEDISLLLTSTTLQGVKRAQSLGLADITALAPLDFFPAVNRFLRATNPSALILVETELWPHLIELSSRRNIPICLISATLSQKSFNRYHRVSFLIKPFLKRIALIAAQSEADAKRFEKLGANPDRIKIVGSLKYDAPINIKNEATLKSIAALGWNNAKIFIAASTHPGEEETILNAYAQARRRFPDLKLVIAPRHVERSLELLSLFKKHLLSPVLYSKINEKFSGSSDCLILDTLGILSGFYPLAILTFVGGTLIDIGGHSLIEPALAKSPVCFGPSTFSNEELAELLIQNDAGFRVLNAGDLSTVLERLAGQSNLVMKSGLRAQESAQSLSGASLKTILAFKDLLNSTRI